MAATVKSFFKKNWLVLATMAITIGILTYFLITTDGIAAFGKIAKTLQVPWFLLMLAAVIGMWVLEGVSLHVIARRIYGRLALTLFFGGGDDRSAVWRADSSFHRRSAHADLLHEKNGHGYRESRCNYCGENTGLSSSCGNFCFGDGILEASLFSGASQQFCLYHHHWAGNEFGCFCRGGWFFAANQKATDKIMRGILKLLHKIKLCKKPEERYQKIHDEFSLFYDSTRLMGRSLSVYLYTALFTIVQLLCTFFVPYLIYRSFNFHTALPITMVAAESLLPWCRHLYRCLVHSGGAEGSFALYFQNVSELGDTLVPAIFVWRIATYYLTIAVGAVVAWVGGKILPKEA